MLLSNPRKIVGHTLVIPHRHVERPWELTGEELSSIFELIRFAQERLLGSIATGIDTRQHHMPFLSENKFKVNHVHFHVMPRTLDDRFQQEVSVRERELFEDLSTEEHDRVAALFQ